MGQTDLVIVLSNLLNNAIEAAAQADPPEVYVRMRKSEDEVVLSVRNRVKKDLNLVDGQLPRISQKGAGHGFGLWNVRDVLKKIRRRIYHQLPGVLVPLYLHHPAPQVMT